ncbi:MAG: aldo/keto reductase [Anaerolineae bacterium]|nr:aldo/keto reductase [Anaerolineae bacterium]
MGNKLELPKIALGATGMTASRFGLGGFHQVEISSEIVTQVVDAFLDVGGNYIETARSYGNGASEEKLGRALKGRRDRVILASKSGRRDGNGIRQELEASLKALRTDHIEFYFFHGVNTMEELDTITAPDGALAALLKAKEEGLITGLGFSSHRPPQMYLQGIERLPLSVILIWDNYLEEQFVPEIQGEVYPLARERGVAITAMKPLADGFLYRSPESAIRYALGSGSEVLICGTNTVEHVYQVARAVCAGAADDEERKAILCDAPELGAYVCRQCGGCSADLMKLFRLEGYVDRQMIDYLEHDPADYALRRRLSGWFDLAGIAQERFASEFEAPDALLVEAGTVDCPYSIDVARKTRLALAKLRQERTDVL